MDFIGWGRTYANQNFGVSCTGGEVVGPGAEQPDSVLVDGVKGLVAACADNVVVQVGFDVG